MHLKISFAKWWPFCPGGGGGGGGGGGAELMETWILIVVAD